MAKFEKACARCAIYGKSSIWFREFCFVLKISKFNPLNPSQWTHLFLFRLRKFYLPTPVVCTDKFEKPNARWVISGKLSIWFSEFCFVLKRISKFNPLNPSQWTHLFLFRLRKFYLPIPVVYMDTFEKPSARWVISGNLSIRSSKRYSSVIKVVSKCKLVDSPSLL